MAGINTEIPVRDGWDRRNLSILPDGSAGEIPGGSSVGKSGCRDAGNRERGRRMRLHGEPAGDRDMLKKPVRSTMRILPCAALILVFVLIVSAGCAAVTPAGQKETRKNETIVFAASSLTGALAEIAGSYETTHPGTKIVMNFDNSQALRTQIEQGARADLFLSANKKQMVGLQEGGWIRNDSVRIFARNRLAILVPSGNPGNITGLSDLPRPGIRLAVGTAEAPFGDYTRQMLAKMEGSKEYGNGTRDAIMNNVISSEPTVPALVAKIRIGEADAGIAFASDVNEGDRASITSIAIPDRYNVVAVYPLGILRESPAPEGAASFAEYLISPAGSAVLARYGFAPAGE